MPKNPGCDTYDVQTIDGQTVEIMDEEAQALASSVLEEALQLIDDTARLGTKKCDARLQAALVTVLQFVDGEWGYYEWKSLADKHKHEAPLLRQ